VLVTEDNHINRYVAQEMLKGLGCHVEMASNGKEALEALSTGSYDLIFMDCQMPVMDGYEATRIIREREAAHSKEPLQQQQGIRRIPIIALTAHSMEGDRERCLEAGMDDYLSKPFSLDGMTAVMKRWLSSQLGTAPSIPSDVKKPTGPA
jgi:CheY-like chemotaxis protein